MNLRNILIISVILAFLTFSCVSADGNFTELQDNIDSTNSTLQLEKDYTYGYGLGDAKTINVSDIEIHGKSHTITSGADTCINVSGNVSFKDINFVSGNLPIVGECNSLIIDNCTFSQNQKNLFINVSSDSIIINNSHFIADVFFNNNDFCRINAKSVTIINSTFTHNEKSSGALDLTCDEFLIANSTFTDFGRDYGGAVNIRKGKGRIVNSSFINNAAKAGGAIYSASELTVIGCEFTNNTILSSASESTTFGGGAIYLKGAKSIIMDSQFISNDGRYYGGAVSIFADNSQILNSTFNKNSAIYGAIYWKGAYGSISNSTFKNNDGFVVNWAGNNGKIYNSEFSEKSNYIDNSIIEWLGSDGMISASKFKDSTIFSIRWKGSKGQVDNCEFSKNSKASIIWEGANGKLTNSVFTECRDVVGWYGANGVMDKCSFEKNTVRAVDWDAKSGKIMNSKFMNNDVFYDVLEVSGKDCLVDKCEFSSNKGQQYGAIKWNSNTGKIQNSIFKHNSAKFGDGAISMGNNYRKISKNNVFEKNTPIEVDIINVFPGVIYYGSNQVLTIKIFQKASAKPMKNVKITLDSDEYITAKYFKTNSKGTVTIKGLSKYDGFGPITNTRTVTFDGKCFSEYSENEADLSNYKYFTSDDLEFNFGFKLVKGKCIVKAPKITAKHKKSKYFKITVKNKFTKKALKKFKLKLKVYTGKKYKTIIVKTNKKGVAKFNTKGLTKGTHKVIIKSKNSNYSINKKSKIRIK